MPKGQPRMMETVHHTTVAGHHLFYRTAGAGSPLVLVHGYGTSGALWLRVLPALAQRHKVFLVDLPGHGNSRLAGPWRLREMAPLLACWLRDMQLPPISLIGQSMGGAIALHLTALAPELVDRLILVSAAGMPLQASLPTLALRSTRSVFQPGSGGYPLRLLRDTLQPRPRVWWQSATEMIESDFREEIATITLPTLILWGERDLLLPIDLGRALHQALPDATFVSLPQSGHRPMLTQPAIFSQIVLDFLSGNPLPM
ncbi:MAG TPA: alpha/beta hydrolase [Ktedonobacteraceae bacterium]|nr:alpha/beta hydrolase [Ktedonobacteraceae bacterium]